MLTDTSVIEKLELFFSNPTRFDSMYLMEGWFIKSRTKNPQLADLGLPYESMTSRPKVRN